VAASFGLAAVYFLAARLGLAFATVGQSVTLVWPATGIALGGLWLGGVRLWPGVALGAFAVNALTPGVPLGSAAGMATGNTLEAVLGMILLRRAGWDPSLGRVADVLKLVGLAALTSTVASATVGTVSLWLGDLVASEELLATWRVWWVGDVMGNLIAVPILLGWRGAGRVMPARWPFEAAALLLALIALVAVVFMQRPESALALAFPYLVFPPLIVVALRLGPRGAACGNAVVSVLAIHATTTGLGPFAGPSLSESLLGLQLFTGVTAVTTLILAAAIAERAQAIRLREDFLSIAAHELRTPLTALQLLFERLARRLAQGAPSEDLAQPLGRARVALSRLERLVEDLLDVTRMGAGSLSPRPEQIELGALVRSVVEALRDDAVAAGCAVELKLEQPMRGSWDRLLLEQTVTNLITNAFKYGRGQPIAVTLDTVGTQARLRVQDRGPGIDAKDQERIFQRFVRMPAPQQVPGLGLGLYIARKIVEAHGGVIGVKSSPGAGATFTVLLPMERAATSGASP